MYYEKVPSDAESEATPLAGVRPSHDRHAVPMSSRAALRVQIILVCLLYAVVGPALVLVNNHILKSLSFPFPLFLSSLGLVTTSLVCAIMLHVVPRLGRSSRAAASSPRAGADMPSPTDGGAALARADRASTERETSVSIGPGGVTFAFWLRNMIPIGAAQGLTFASTNAAYMYLTITFTQARAPRLEESAHRRVAATAAARVCRRQHAHALPRAPSRAHRWASYMPLVYVCRVQILAAFTPSVTLVLLYLFSVETPTLRASVCVFFIGVGCAVSSYGEGHWHPLGVAYRSLGIVSEATRLVLTQHLLKNHKLSVFESQYYLAPVGASFLLVGALFSEAGKAQKMDALGTIAAHPVLFAASAGLGVVASMLTFLVIKVRNAAAAAAALQPSQQPSSRRRRCCPRVPAAAAPPPPPPRQSECCTLRPVDAPHVALCVPARSSPMR
jgi:hypothetical protein